jgi:hypothetical protein
MTEVTGQMEPGAADSISENQEIVTQTDGGDCSICKETRLNMICHEDMPNMPNSTSNLALKLIEAGTWQAQGNERPT